MKRWTRREVIKSGLIASALGSVPPLATRADAKEAIDEAASPIKAADTGQPSRTSLDFGWRFSLGHASDPVRDFGFGSASRERSYAKSGRVSWVTSEKFDDSAWRTVDLPHDWAVELPFVSAKPLPEQGARALGREWPETSVGWYRRSFELLPEDAESRIWLEFDGIMRQADIFLNDHYLLENFSGYAPVRLDVTDWVNAGDKNTLVVRCDASLGEGWFYEGAGIYRHVWLNKTPQLHLVPDGTFVNCELTGGDASLNLHSEVKNCTDSPRTCRVTWELRDAEGKAAVAQSSAAVTILPWGEADASGTAHLRPAKLWSCENPYLYTLVIQLVVDGIATHVHAESFGVRTLRFDADEGFFLNGKPVKIKGTCNHQDHAGLGSALPDRVQEFRMERLKSMRSNAVRTSHNPPAPERLDAADRMGMLVMCETRMMDSSAEGLSQLERMIRRFRNHPSIFIWSLGNEEPEQGTARGARIMATMKRLARKLDPSRQVTAAMNGSFGKGVSAVVDVQGCNYYEEGIDDFHRKFPQQPMIGTETASTLATRGIYQTDKDAGYVTAYDRNVPPWGKTAESWWKFYATRPFLAGGFLWTGFDYRGEPTPYSWPCVSSHFGVIDTCGFPKDDFFYYKAWWGNEPSLHLFPHWNWEPGREVEVWVHTNLDRAELLLNGRSLGALDVERNGHAEWKVPFEAGKLEAHGCKDGKVVLTAVRETTGAPAKVVVTADRETIAADSRDVAMLSIAVQDSAGRVVPTARNSIRFEVSGGGQLLGVGNGDPSCHEPDKADSRSAFNGLCAAIVQSTRREGEITVAVSADGLQGSIVTIKARV